MKTNMAMEAAGNVNVVQCGASARLLGKFSGGHVIKATYAAHIIRASLDRLGGRVMPKKSPPSN